MYNFLSETSANMCLDGSIDEQSSINTGVPQRLPSSPLLFLIYTTSLYRKIRKTCAKVAGFIDDIAIYVTSEPEKNAEKVYQLGRKEQDGY